MHVQHIDHLNLSVADLAASRDWYARVFGFEFREQGTHRGAPWSILQSGEALLCLSEYPQRELLDGDALRDRSIHGLNHFGLRITDREIWEQVIRSEGLEILYDGVVEWPHSLAWYVRDPSGYEIEVALWNDDEVRFPDQV